MVEYLKTKKGYFYKLKKNGEKKDIARRKVVTFSHLRCAKVTTFLIQLPTKWAF